MVNYIVIMEHSARMGGSEGKDGMAKRGRKRKIWPLLLAVLVLFAVWENRSVQVEEFAFASERLPEGLAGLRIAQLSDLHGAEFGRDNERLLAAVAGAEPDLILVTGDLVDEDTAEPAAYAGRVGAALTAIAPTYFVTGNHEWAAHAVQELEPLLEENGVHVLSNTYVMLERGGDKIALLGAEDSNGYADQKTIAELSEEVRQEQGDVYKILLSHRNTRIEEYVDAHIDLTLCGHAHGGLIRLPGTDGLIGPHREFFPSYTAGLYDLPYGQLVASRGLGNQFPAFRLFNRPDVPVVVLE